MDPYLLTSGAPCSLVPQPPLRDRRWPGERSVQLVEIVMPAERVSRDCDSLWSRLAAGGATVTRIKDAIRRFDRG